MLSGRSGSAKRFVTRLRKILSSPYRRPRSNSALRPCSVEQGWKQPYWISVPQSSRVTGRD